MGLENLVWRTPGPDGGRDIEGDLPTRDLSGSLTHQHWFIECKRYSYAVDWPTVWNKLSFASNNDADFLLFVMTTTLSPTCETEISKWNLRKIRPAIRAWRSYELEGILSRFPSVRLKYGLLEAQNDKGASFVSLAVDAMKFTQSAYAAAELGQKDRGSLEAAAALAELLSARMQDFESVGKIVIAGIDPNVDLYPWLTISLPGELPPVDRFGFRALASVFRAALLCETVSVKKDGGTLAMLSEGKGLAMTSSALSVLQRVGFWSNFEVACGEDVPPVDLPRTQDMVQGVDLRKRKDRLARMEEAAKVADVVMAASSPSPLSVDVNVEPEQGISEAGAEAQGSNVEPFDLQLLSNFIHQVVNPLNGVAGILDNVIEGRVEGPGRAEQRLKAARAQLEQQCISLVRNLAYFAQGFSALAPTERRAVTVPQVIIEAAQVFQEQARNKEIFIDLLNRQDQNQIFGHHELIRQIFVNLFDNATKYSEPGTNIIIEQRVQERRSRILITAQSQSARPLSQQDLGRIFELGFRGRNAREIVASGTGLGLYICKRIAEDVHSGEMWAEATREGKVTFFISFPRIE